ncbi:hypothetical protein GB931_05040 [Modestobacter sp. I12A-02628]|uniref:Lipoprotein n=1 Tax=Goekera deserti TaxID=2497753 RepID=A0A7K3WH21_9ACTN|nr:hypothetical protein [Goekera deserti]MPQ97303.1 hypothetical protein [Goekera deserti]NDI50186.1 hypothetical protein [Goekera deserti]NEL55754.1 hypothetical protein [Goekera deserti]
MSRCRPAAAVLLLVALAGCGGADPGRSTAGPATTDRGSTAPASAPPVPGSADELGALLLSDVPSGLPRVPDEDLDPPAGPKTVDDVAGYADDAEHERSVLEGYGYRWGWERFWQADGAQTTVFLDQFTGAPGARAYAEDLARNDAGYYSGELRDDDPRAPEGCRVLVVDRRAAEARGMGGPAVLGWCARGHVSVAVSAVAATPAAAAAEMYAALEAQLARLPG